MKELFKKIEEVRKSYTKEFDFLNNRHVIAEYFCKKYPNIPIDIMEYYFVRHSNQGLETLTGLPDIKAIDIKVSTIELTNDNLMDENIIQYAPFASYNKPKVYCGEDFKQYYNWYKNEYLKNGSWTYPIITVKYNGKFYVIDGTFRFSQMLICLVNNFDFIANKHLIYVLNS